MTNNSAIKITDLKKYYGAVNALQGINIEIPKGSFFGLLGPNGAGKTTTINIITGLVKITSGEVNVMGFDIVKHYRQSRKQIGLSPQEFNFDHFFSIRNLLSFQAGYYGFDKSASLERADIVLEHFGLTAKAEMTPRQLSGGMKRRLQIAKALVHDPPIIILDEPTAGIDLELRYMLWEYLKQINSEGKTILLTTHYIDEAEFLCNQVAIINNGKIITKGRTKDLINQIGGGSIEVKVRNWDKGTLLKNWTFTYRNGYLHIQSENPEKDMPRIVEIISNNGVFVEEIKTTRTTLEDVFLKLTGKSIDD